DVLLACAEGYTQVTGVMAMMMTGRVLLVCALCVLWCGLFGVAADFVGSANGSAGDYWGSWWITKLRREWAEEVGRRTGGRTNVSAVEECVRQGIDGVRAVVDGRRRWGPQRSAVVVVAADDAEDPVKNGDSSERSFLSEQSSQAGRVLPSGGGGGSGSLPGGEGGTGHNPPPPHSSTGPSLPNLPEKQASAAEEEEGVKSDPKDNENKPGERLRDRETPIDNQNTQNPEETPTGKKLHEEDNKTKQLLQGDNQQPKVEEIVPRKPVEEPPREKEDVDEP
ncbi:mucin-associated surface protein (MASP), putative, partial [Trypanosoma cruzi]